MGDALSALIAFAGFLMLFSMLVTSFQDALKNYLNLKTGVWERFFVSIYRHDFRMNTSPVDKGTTYRERRRKPFVGEFENRLQRLKKLLVDAEEPFRRFESALDGIAGIDPQSPDAAGAILEKLKPLRNALPEVKGLRLDALLSIYDQVSGEKIKGIYQGIHSLENRISTFRRDVASENGPGSVVEGLITKSRQLTDLIEESRGLLSEYRIQIEKKADAWLSQLQQEYKKNMLKWTVIIGTLLVLAFNADAFAIFRFLLNDVDARKAAVAATSETVVSNRKSRSGELNAIEEMLRGNEIEGARSALTAFLKKWKAEYESLPDGQGVKEIDGLLEKIETDPPLSVPDLQNDFNRTVTLFVSLQKKTLEEQLKGVASLDLPLGWGGECARWSAFGGGWEKFLYACRKIGGLLLTAALITFGAPFWKDLMNALVGAKKMLSKTGQ